MSANPIGIVRREVASIIPPPWNARTDHDVDGIADSIRIHGMRDPIGAWVTQDGERLPEPHLIVEGSGRWVAVESILQWDEVDVIEHDFDSSASARAYAIAHNRYTDRSRFDDAVLLATLEELPSLEGTGFERDEMEEIQERLDADAEPEELLTDPDDVPEEQDATISVRGDVWLLGDHRVMCGDATSEEDVTALLAGNTPGLMVTDPPYGVAYDAEWRNDALDEADRRVGKVTNDDRVDWSEAWALAPCDVAYVWHASWFIADVQRDMQAAGFDLRNLIVWGKSRFSISRGHYHWQHEPCWYAVRRGATAEWAGDRSQTTLWSIELDPNAEGGHSTQKPLECMARPMRNHAHPGVYDPFLGSGTTLIAAQTLGRTCFGMEIEPGYTDVAVRRWINATGGEATRESDGEAFPTGDA